MASIFDEERLYLELQENFIAEQKAVNAGLITIGKELGLPLGRYQRLSLPYPRGRCGSRGLAVRADR